jgi:hypothetical protein
MDLIQFLLELPPAPVEFDANQGALLVLWQSTVQVTELVLVGSSLGCGRVRAAKQGQHE